MDIERRFFTCELRATGDGDEPSRIIGHAALFDQLSENLGGFKEIIKPGAFTDTIADDDIRALWNHNPNYVLGRNTSGTLDLAQDAVGLRYEVEPPDSQFARDFMTSIERGDVNQSSFGFKVVEESWISPSDDEPLPIRVLHRVTLFDVSPVTFPAYPATSAEARARAQEMQASTAGASGEAAEPEPAGGRPGLLRRQLELRQRRFNV